MERFRGCPVNRVDDGLGAGSMRVAVVVLAMATTVTVRADAPAHGRQAGTAKHARSAKPGNANAKRESAKAGAAEGHPEEQARRARVLVRYLGGEVTVGELEDAIAGRPDHALARLSTREGQEKLLRSLVDYELLVREAERRGFGDHPVVRAEFARASAEALVKYDLPADPEAVDEAAVMARFKAARADQTRPALRRAGLIVVPTRARAEALRSELAGKGRTAFIRAARAQSVHPSRAQGGSLSEFDAQGRVWPRSTGETVPAAVAKAAFATERDRVSRVFPVGEGFGLVRVGPTRAAFTPTRAALEPRLREALALEAQGRAISALAEARRERTQVVAHPELLDLLGERRRRKPSGIPSDAPVAPIDPSAPSIAAEDDGV